MENASKALLIAGAILIVLAIIAIAVAVFGDSKILVNSFANKLTKSEIENHNNAFMIYDGQVIGSEVINACIKAREINNKQKKINMTICVKIGGTTYEFDNDTINEYDIIINVVGTNYKTNIFEGNIIYGNDGVLSKIEFELVV